MFVFNPQAKSPVPVLVFLSDVKDQTQGLKLRQVFYY